MHFANQGIDSVVISSPLSNRRSLSSSCGIGSFLCLYICLKPVRFLEANRTEALP